jgi:hypothetical protein
MLVYLKVRSLMAYVLYELGLGAGSVILYEKKCGGIIMLHSSWLLSMEYSSLLYHRLIHLQCKFLETANCFNI